MGPRLRLVKSEIPVRFTKRKIKTERTKTPVRFSRRLRHLPPENFEFLHNKTVHIKKEKIDDKHVISQKSSVQFRHNQRRNRARKFRYPQRAKNSKEIISILSAPKICHKKAFSDKKIIEIPVKVRNSCCRARVLENNTASKFPSPVKQENPPGTERILQKRKKYVLDVLNKGETKDIEKLPTVGTKTAERIILYRQLKGSINKISELAKMPKFPKKRFHNFMAQNFLKVD